MTIDTCEREIYKNQIIELINKKLNLANNDSGFTSAVLYSIVVDFSSCGMYYGSKVSSYDYYGYLSLSDISDITIYLSLWGTY